MEKIHNYLNAYDRLAFAVAKHADTELDDLERDGLIQRFEFTFELAWKSLKEYMEAQGVADLKFPKQVLREAYTAGLIDNDKIWLAMLSARNSTSHIYDEDAAERIVNQVSNDFLPLFRALAGFYRAQETEKE